MLGKFTDLGVCDLTEYVVQSLLAAHFNIRHSVVAPNISWGFFRDGREVDILVIRPSLWCDEIEIKLTSSDIKAELPKRRYLHDGDGLPDMIRARYFCVPSTLKDDPNIPKTCGVLALDKHEWSGRWRFKIHRSAEYNAKRRKLTQDEYCKILRLCHMRMWNLRDKSMVDSMRNTNKRSEHHNK